MKKKTRNLIVAALLAIATCCIGVACSNKNDNTTSQGKMVLSETQIAVDVYDTAQIQVLSDVKGEIVWSTSDPAKAIVENGLVVPQKPGTVEITATDKKSSAKCTVEIRTSDEAPTAEIMEDRIALGLGERYETEIFLFYKNEPLHRPTEWNYSLVDGANEKVASMTVTGATVSITAEQIGETCFRVFTQIYDIPLIVEIPVSVYDDSVSFVSSSLPSCEGGFTASLGLIDSAVSVKSIAMNMAVYEDGAIVPNAAIEWTTQDNGVFALDQTTGSITAVQEGDGTVTGRYKSNSFTVYVHVFRPVLKGQRVTIETVLGNYVDLPSTIEGSLNGATLNGKAVQTTRQENRIYLGQEKLQTQENNILSLETEKAFYEYDLDIYTKVLRTAEDLDNFGAWAKAENSANNLWSGYFVLGNDIPYNKTFAPFISSATAGMLPNWYHGTKNGFNGVFDGKGHTIEGMEVRGNGSSVGGFIGVIHVDGVVKNISFTNAIVGKGQGFVCASNYGKVENIYVQCIRQESGYSSEQVSGFFSVRDTVGQSRFKNCFVDTTLASGAIHTVGIGSIHEGYGILDGVYCVGIQTAYRLLSTAGGTKNVCAAYENYQQLLSSGVNFESWESEFWTVRNGIPVPKTLTPSKDQVKATLSSNRVEAGKTLTIEIGKTTVISLSADAIFAGIIIDGNEIIIPEDIETDVAFIVVARSVISGAEIELSFTIVGEGSLLPGENDNIDDWQS